VIRVNPITGAQTVLTSGGSISCLSGIAVGPTGDLFLSAGCPNVANTVIQVNPTTGTRTVIGRGDNFTCIEGLTVASSGDPVVLNGGCPGSADLVVQLDPATGAQTVIARGDHLNCPADVAVGPGEDLFVTFGPAQARPACPSGSSLGIVRVNPSTGAQTLVSSGGEFVGPSGIAVAPGGQLFVADSNCCGVPGSVIRVDPVTGAQTVVATGGNFNQPLALTFVQPPPLTTPPAPGTGCARPGAVCHAELTPRHRAGSGSPMGAVTAAGSIETGPCPSARGQSCLAFETRDGFTVSGTIGGLGPGYIPVLRVPTARADGTALGVRELSCEPANSSGQARCRAVAQEEGVFPRHGDTLLVRATCPVSVGVTIPCHQIAHP
jgi:hypothetical protein